MYCDRYSEWMTDHYNLSDTSRSHTCSWYIMPLALLMHCTIVFGGMVWGGGRCGAGRGRDRARFNILLSTHLIRLYFLLHIFHSVTCLKPASSSSFLSALNDLFSLVLNTRFLVRYLLLYYLVIPYFLASGLSTDFQGIYFEWRSIKKHFLYEFIIYGLLKPIETAINLIIKKKLLLIGRYRIRSKAWWSPSTCSVLAGLNPVRATIQSQPLRHVGGGGSLWVTLVT